MHPRLIVGRRKRIAFQRPAQGSAAAPTLWGRLAALVMRLTQSLFESSKLRLVCYVDDPLAAVLCTEEQRRMMTTLMVLIWSALGFKLAFSKDQHDRKVTWIGGALWIEKHGIRASVKQTNRRRHTGDATADQGNRRGHEEGAPLTHR